MDAKANILATGPFNAANVQIIRCESPVIPSEARSYIDQRWEEYCREARLLGRKLFNSSVTHLADFQNLSGKLVLNLAKSDYKTFLVTCLRDHGWFLAHFPKAIISGMGNSVLLTHKGEAILGLRGGSVAYYAGRAHIFGGVMDWPEHDLSQGLSGSEPILAHLYRELEEELNLDKKSMADVPRVMGLFYDPALNQPELVWHAELADSNAIKPEHLNQDEHEKFIRVRLDNPSSSPAPLTPVTVVVLNLASQWRR